MLNLARIWQNFNKYDKHILVYVWIRPQFGQIWPKFSNFRANSTNVVLTTNGQLDSISLALDTL